jgi:hypothetical protein
MKNTFAKFSSFLNRSERKTVWAITIAIGTVARVLIALRGHNLDYLAWLGNASVLRGGGNLYSGNETYGYGPVWMFVLRFADLAQNIFSENRQVFRLVIILVLTIFDLMIAIFIAKKFSLVVGLLFFVNPISVIITGYHNQFDNLAVLVGIGAILVISEAEFGNRQKTLWFGLALTGLSLAVKQVLLFYPIWLFFRAGTLRQRLTRVAVPYVIYLACFAPWATSIERIKIIVEEIFLQRRGRSGILLNLAGADYAGTIHGATYSDLARQIIFAAWIIGVFAFGWIMRNRSIIHSLVVYLVVMLAFAPAYSQQQLILPLLAVFIYATTELKIFYVVTLIFMVQNSDELGIEFFFPFVFRLNGTIYAWLQVLLIFFSLRIIFKDHPSNLKSENLRAALKLN